MASRSSRAPRLHGRVPALGRGGAPLRAGHRLRARGDEPRRAAEREGEGRRGAIVGFALTVLQRRLASSPEAIYQSLRRRRERLENRVREEERRRRGAEADDRHNPRRSRHRTRRTSDDIDDRARRGGRGARGAGRRPGLRRADDRRARGRDRRRWRASKRSPSRSAAQARTQVGGALGSCSRTTSEMFDAERQAAEAHHLLRAPRHAELPGRARSARSSAARRRSSTIHGGMRREERREAQEAFTQDQDVLVLVATDAAGEGINLQRAHLMVNYDLPWNPNRIEQRFGRIHRIGQTEVCHLWNLVAVETREGEVFQRLLEKLEHAARSARRPGLRRPRDRSSREVAPRPADRGGPLRRAAGGPRQARRGRRRGRRREAAAVLSRSERCSRAT